MQDGRESSKYPLKYDVENSLLEIKWIGKVKRVRAEYLYRFCWTNKFATKTIIFLSSQDYQLSQSSVVGFVELAYANRDSLLIQNGTVLKKPNYFAGLDMGKSIRPKATT